MNQSLKNKRVVITGASSGIGFALTKLLINEECNIIASARTIEGKDLFPPEVFVKNCDVSNEESLNQLFDYAVDKFGNIDIFIANAGFSYYEVMKNINYEHIRKIYDTNVTSVIYGASKMQALHPNGDYQYMVTASGMSFLNIPGYALYGSTKAALRGFYEGYSHELVNRKSETLTKPGLLQMVYPIATKTHFFDKERKVPVPWPTQEVAPVAKSMLKALKTGRKHTYPSKLFHLGKWLNGIFPFVFLAYGKIENIKFKKWQRKEPPYDK